MTIATLIVDDHDDVRLLLRLVLEASDSIEVVGEAANGQEALDRYRDLHPAVIVLDEMMPGMSGLEVVRALHERGDEPRVVLCSAHLDRQVLAQASMLGIDRCISKANMEDTVVAVKDLAETG